MKAITRLLLMLVVVLSFVREAGAESEPPLHNYTFEVAEYRLGFEEHLTIAWALTKDPTVLTTMYASPFGSQKVPFTATQGLVGFCVIAALLVIVPLVFTMR